MSICFIGKGKFSKYYLYILVASILKLLKKFLYGFEYIDPDFGENLFDYFPELSRYPLVQSLYK